MNAPRYLPLVAATVMLATACSQAVTGGMVTHFFIKKQAEIVGQTRNDARLIVHVIREAPLTDFKVQKLPAFNSASLILSNYNTPALLTANLTKDLSVGTSTGDINSTTNKATSVWTALRPGTKYKLECTVKNNGTRTGYGYADGITLAAGVNVVTIIISVDGDIKVTTSGSKNKFNDDPDGWLIVKGDTYTFGTGFDANEHQKSTAPASLKMRVILDDKNYDTNGSLTNNTSRVIADVTSGFDTFTLDTGTGTGTTAGTFNKDELAVTDTSTSNGYNSTITFRMMSGSQVVGESKLTKVKVIEGSSVDLQLQ